MTFSMMVQAAYDFWRGRGYGLKEYVIRDGKKHPFALICPGGGYGMVCSFAEGAPYAKKLNELGYSAFVLYYRCGKKAAFPAPQGDLAKALRNILSRADELSLETESYSLWGSSAGGHLAAAFGTEKIGYSKYSLPKPGALILSYPVITMGELTHEGSRKNLLGEDPTEEMVRLTSIEYQVTGEYPPAFLWCGDADRTVDPENSRMMAKALQENGVTYQFIEYPAVGHGVGLGTGLSCEPWFLDAVSFWERQRTGGKEKERA